MTTRSIVFLFAVSLVQSSLANDDSVIRLSEPVSETLTHEIFGDRLPESGEPLSLKSLIAQSDLYMDQPVTVETRVAKVCQKKGCFFIAQEGPVTARVTFKDYSFFIPTNSANKPVTLYGIFSRSVVSEEEAHHFAKDLGENSTEAGAGIEYTIVASSVSIPKAEIQ
jgi:hypothetical protein